jgi:hypothetical protein
MFAVMAVNINWRLSLAHKSRQGSARFSGYAVVTYRYMHVSQPMLVRKL